MTDEELQKLRDEHEKCSDQQVLAKRSLEDKRRKLGVHSSEVQRLGAELKADAEPYKLLTERVAILSAAILAEDRRRADEAEAARKAARAAEEAAKAAEQPAA